MRIVWKVNLPFDFLVDGTGPATNQEMAGEHDGTRYTLTLVSLIRKEYSEDGDYCVCSCNSLRLETRHSDSAEVSAARTTAAPVANEILNRFLRGVRYCSRQLQVRPLTARQFASAAAQTASLSDDGEHIENKVVVSISDDVRRYRGEIAAFMAGSGDVVVEYELLHDAYEAYDAGNVRRAVLDAAIAAEVLVKSYIYAKGGRIYEIIADKHVLSYSTADFFDVILDSLDQRSLKTERPGTFSLIKHLFETRNKIAHAGRCGYNNNRGWQQVGLPEAKRFLDAVREVFKWLKGTDMWDRSGYISLR